MTNNNKYRITVIVPVYNVEDYLERCLVSLINQSIPKEDLEVLLVDDGSTDRSYHICKKYSDIYDFFKVYHKKNSGLSSTRNFALKRASGKYVAFLDSDDELSSETLKNVCDLFDKIYGDVDVVTYPIVPYKNGKKMKLHYRYTYLTKTGIYDINNENNIFITQTNINIVAKTEKAKNILFDTSPDFHQEDQKFISDLLIDKQRIGFCKEAEYKYFRRDNSITGTLFNPIELFEASQKYFEDMFASFERDVPRYYQVMYFHDLQWKLKANILFPYHYNKEDFSKALQRIKKLLCRVDDEVIWRHPDVDNFHKVFWTKMKPNSKAECIPFPDKICIFIEGKKVYSRNKIELILHRIRLTDEKVKIYLTVKSPVFSFLGKPVVSGIINGTHEKEIRLQPSAEDYYHCRTKTNDFYYFCFEHELDNMCELYFVVETNGFRYSTNYYFMPYAPFSLKQNVLTYTVSGRSVTFKANVFYFNTTDVEATKNINNAVSKRYLGANNYDLTFRERAINFNKKSEIWLYYDCKGVINDNGYYQFIHDIEKNDNIVRYYVMANNYDPNDTLFSKIIDKVIPFGSDLHKLLFINADKILTAFIETNNYIPFSPSEFTYYKDLLHYELVYLQHGILHATLPWKYHPERIFADRIIVSSKFEINNFTEKYCFNKKDLIVTGMPRYDLLTKKQKNKRTTILFAPTWRHYLISSNEKGWQPKNDLFYDSNYYKGIQSVIFDNELIDFLNSNNIELHLKLHPIFSDYISLFEHTDTSIKIIEKDDAISQSDYSLFITDFSSFVFDFAYLNVPIIYFIPDMQEFKAGLNTYRELDYKLEDGFGPLTTSTEELISNIKAIVNNNFITEVKYIKRMNNFFIDIKAARENIYRSLCRG